MNQYIQTKLQEKESQLRNGFLSNASRIRKNSKTTSKVPSGKRK